MFDSIAEGFVRRFPLPPYPLPELEPPTLPAMLQPATPVQPVIPPDLPIPTFPDVSPENPSSEGITGGPQPLPPETLPVLMDVDLYVERELANGSKTVFRYPSSDTLGYVTPGINLRRGRYTNTAYNGVKLYEYEIIDDNNPSSVFVIQSTWKNAVVVDKVEIYSEPAPFIPPDPTRTPGFLPTAPTPDRRDRPRFPPILVPDRPEIFIGSPRFIPGLEPVTIPFEGRQPAPSIPPEIDPNNRVDDPEIDLEPLRVAPPPIPNREVQSEESEEDDRRVGAPIPLPQLQPTEFLPSNLPGLDELPLPETDSDRLPPRGPGLCLCVGEIRREGERTRDFIEGLLEDAVNQILEALLPDEEIEQRGTIAIAECDENGGPFFASQAFSDLPGGIDLLSQQIAQIRFQLGLCDRPPEQADPSILLTGEMTLGDTVRYVALSDDVREVELVITGEIPASVRTFRGWGEDERQAKFGFISAAYPMVAGGFGRAEPEMLVWTRRTVLQLGEPYRANRNVRIFLKPGLNFLLRDTGLRS